MEKIKRLFSENKVAVVSAVVILLFVAAAILAPMLTPYSPKEMDMAHRLSPPSSAHLLGTDEGGRDILTRMLYGSRVSLLAGVLPTLMSMVIGTALGLISGFAGGKTDDLIMRIADIMLAFPSTLLAMIIMYTLGGGLINVFLTLSLVGWAGIARVVRSEAMRLKSSAYVSAARLIGVPQYRIVLRHILPNCIPTLIVLGSALFDPHREQPQLPGAGHPAAGHLLGPDDQSRAAVPVQCAVAVFCPLRGDHADRAGIQLPGRRTA